MRDSGAVCFCGTFLRVAPTGRYPAPCPSEARTFLALRRGRPAYSATPKYTLPAGGGPAGVLKIVRLGVIRLSPPGILHMTERLAVPPPFQSISDVAEGLAALERQFEAMRDRRSLFVTTYIATTRTIGQWIDRGIFQDGGATTRYVVAFANAYRRALSDYTTGERARVPVAWQQAFDACDRADRSVFQCLMLGINAHMNRDLPHAVIAAEVDVNSADCYRDYERIDDVLQLNMPLVRRRIADAYGAEMPLVQRWFGGFGDARVMRGFRRARKNSWALAQLLAHAETPTARAGAERLIEERSEIEGRKIMGLRHAAPSPLALNVFAVARPVL